MNGQVTPTAPAAETADTPDPGRWRILAVLLTTMFMSLVGVSIVNVVLPSIQTGLHADDTDIQWVLSGYALTFGVVLVAAGRAGDIVGRAPIFLAGVVIFTLASVGAGLAPDPLTLNIARFIQGLGSGLLNPQVVGMIQHHFRGRERGRAYGALGSVVGVSVAIGPLIGGVIIRLFGAETGWRWTFLVNVPVGVVAIILALLWFPRPLFTRRPDSPVMVEPDVGITGKARRRGERERDLDPIGALLLGVAVLALLLPFMQGEPTIFTWLLLPAGLLLVAVWVAWEKRYRARGRSPMVDLELFRTGSFSYGTVIAGLYFLGVTSVWVLVALYLQNGLQMTALDTGLMGLPAALTSAVVSDWAGKRVADYGGMIVIGGILASLLGLGLSILAIQLNAHAGFSIWWLALALLFIGIAQGAVISPNQTLTLTDVPLRYSGSAGGVLQTGQRIGTAVGLALVTAIFFATLAASDWQGAFTTSFVVITGVVLVSLAVAMADERRRRRN